MTREEEIRDLEVLRAVADRWADTDAIALGMAIEALSAEAEDRHYIKIYADDEPSVKAEKLYQICGETQNGEVAEWLKEYFPSAEPKTGHWVEIEDYNGDIHYQCDQCGEEFILIDGTPEDNNYWHCPNCGSYNREVRKHEDRYIQR